jgi:hypothetical protein
VGVERLTVVRSQAFGNGVKGLEEDAFEHVDAVAIVALDPDHPANRFVTDLRFASRDADGMVRLETDVVLVRPRPGTSGNGARGSAASTDRGSRLLFVVANRGLVTSLPFSAGVQVGATPDGSIDPGDAWILRRGLSVAWVGWQWDVARRPGVVGIDVPEAVGPGGRPLHSQARLEFLPLVPQPHRRLADEVGPWMGQFAALPAADLGEQGAALTVRDWFNGPRRTIDRSRWRFARDVDGTPVADDEHVWLDGGFEARRHYEVVYTTRRCPVAGAGLAAVRDVVSHLRATAGFGHVLSTGSSQSGRWLREFVLDTANTAEDGSRVFDGVHCHIAGGRRGEFNNRSAQPSTMNSLGFTHLPPHGAEQLLARARARGNAPHLVVTNTATEYWRGDASLVHTDDAGRDVADGPDWRAYLYAGAHHAAGLPNAYTAQLPVQLGPNRVTALWAIRAHLAALDEWVADGRLPPPSEVPRVADGSGVARADVLGWLAGRPLLGDVTLPAPVALLGMPPIDLGPDVAEGIGRYPALVTGDPLPCVVAAVDEDGNERCGVRLPEVAVPLGLSFGWNPEIPRPDPDRSGSGRHPVELWNLLGGGVAFEPGEVLSRYGDRAGYLQRVRACVDELVAGRHLLAEDVGSVMTGAAAGWDRAVEPLT